MSLLLSKLVFSVYSVLSYMVKKKKRLELIISLPLVSGQNTRGDSECAVRATGGLKGMGIDGFDNAIIQRIKMTASIS